jgi:hypothetical protein
MHTYSTDKCPGPPNTATCQGCAANAMHCRCSQTIWVHAASSAASSACQSRTARHRGNTAANPPNAWRLRCQADTNGLRVSRGSQAELPHVQHKPSNNTYTSTQTPIHPFHGRLQPQRQTSQRARGPHACIPPSKPHKRSATNDFRYFDSCS